MINMINKKTYMCLFIILILMMLGVSVVSAEDVSNQTASTEPSATTVTHQEINEINTQKEVAISNDEITHTDTAANTTKKSIKKVANKEEDLKTSEAPSADGYNLYQVGSASEFTRKGNKAYYNLTNDIVFTKTSDGAVFDFQSGDDIVINGNGHIISYDGTNKVYFSLLVSGTNPTTNYIINDVIFENFTDSVLSNLQAGPGNLNITNCIFRNNKNPRDTDESGGGGAIMISHGATNRGTINIMDSTFINNSANRGGAIFYNDPVNLYIMNCYFANNSAFGSRMTDRNGGGAIYAEDGASVNLISCDFENNTFNRSGVVETNNIAVYGNTKVLGYNIKVNGFYVTDLTNNTLGIYASNQNTNYGFHGNVATYDTTTEIMADEPYINNTIYITIHTIEEGFNSSLGNLEMHITITAPNGVTVVDEDVTTDEDGYLYYDFTSDIKGIYEVTSNIKEVYGKVLRKVNDVQVEDTELIYRASTTTKSLNYYRINT
ncbi:MAG: hypothetical protein BZ138_01350, partial [Methanosphaera sp. rholeuAM270]